MTSTQIIEQVKNYQGTNSFIIKMKDSLRKWGSLTTKQVEAVQKCLAPTKPVVSENLPEDLKKLVDYKGENKFVNDIKSKFLNFGTLTDRQKSAALEQIKKEESKNRTVKMNWPTEGETIVLGRTAGQKLKENYDLKFNPYMLDITKVLAVSPKAVKFSGKMTIQRSSVCFCCGKTLTDEFSMLTGVGKVCAKHLGITYIKDKSEVNRFRDEYLKKVEEIGEMEFWVPKSQIKKWDGVTGLAVSTL